MADPRKVSPAMRRLRQWVLTMLPLCLAGCASTPPPYPLWLDQTVAGGASAAADTNRPPADLSVDAAVRFALAHNPELAVLRAAAEVAWADSRAAGDLVGPELRAGFGKEHMPAEVPDWIDRARNITSGSYRPLEGRDPSSDALSRSVALRFSPPNPWTRKACRSAAAALAWEADANLRAESGRVASEVRRLFEDLQQARQAEIILDRSVAIRQEQMRSLEARLSGGQAMSLDVMAATRRYLDAAAERAQMAASRDLALRQIAGLMGVPSSALLPGFQLPVASLVPAPSALPDVKILQEQALRQRADLEAGYWQWRAALASLAESRTLEWPWISFIQGTVGVTDDGSSDLTEHEWRMDLGITLPLFAAWHGTTAARAAKVRQCEEQLRAIQNRIRLEVGSAAEAVRQAADRLRESGAATASVDRMRRLLTEMSARPDVSAITVADLKELIARSEYTMLAPQAEYRKALVSLEQALGAGVPPPVE